MILSQISLFRCSVSKFSSAMLRGMIDRWVNIVALKVRTVCDISITSFLMGPRNSPRHYFADGNEFGVI